MQHGGEQRLEKERDRQQHHVCSVVRAAVQSTAVAVQHEIDDERNGKHDLCGDIELYGGDDILRELGTVEQTGDGRVAVRRRVHVHEYCDRRHHARGEHGDDKHEIVGVVEVEERARAGVVVQVHLWHKPDDKRNVPQHDQREDDGGFVHVEQRVMTDAHVAVDSRQHQGQVGRHERREEQRLGEEAVRPPGAGEELDGAQEPVQPRQGVRHTEGADEDHLRASAAGRVARRCEGDAIRRHDDDAEYTHDDADGEVDLKRVGVAVAGVVRVVDLKRRQWRVWEHARILLAWPYGSSPHMAVHAHAPTGK